MTGLELPALAAISDEVLEDALGRLRAQDAEPRGPILYLEAVSSRLRRQALLDTRPHRATMLREILRELTWHGLCASRGLVNGHCPPIEDDCLSKDLAADFRVGRRDRKAWSAVWYRFLSDEAPTGDEVERMANLSRQTFWRRQKNGIALLRQALLASEAVAREGLAGPELPSPPSPDERQRAQAATILQRVKDALTEDRPDALDLEAADRRLILSRSWDSLDLYRLRQALVWSDERYQLDERFVDLTLLIDQGEAASSERWSEQAHYESLDAALAVQPAPAFVVLGAPGSGKSTLLRHHELGIMLDGLRGTTERLSLYVPLSRYGSRDDDVIQPPHIWLAAQWAADHPDLPPLPDLLAEQRVTLLLDAVNEMPHRDADAYLARVSRWRTFIVDLATRLPGNRVVFSCRSLDYSAPLSTNDLTVPQLRIEPLDDKKVQSFLGIYCPRQAVRVWESLKGQRQLGLLRTPFLLRMLALQAERRRQVPTGRAALFSSFIRGALRHEVNGGNLRFLSGPLLSARDRQRILNTEQWPQPFDLPGSGLFSPLACLAYAMQDQRGSKETSQIRLSYDAALDILDAELPAEHAEAVLLGGRDLGVLDQERGRDELLFRHQLFQEYFAARKLAEAPNASLSASEWRADAISPTMEQELATLAPADPLPPLKTTGWEETTLLAAAMTGDQDAFVDQLAETNLPLAGRCAAQPESKVSEPVKERLRWTLVNRSRDVTADLRARIAAGEALGELGDPRFKRCVSAEGVEYLLPPMVRVPAGMYTIGSDEGIYPEEAPEHQVWLDEFWIGQFPVTNAEYACFIKAGGYEDERWWVGEAAQRWWRGEGTDDWAREQDMQFYNQFKAQPQLLQSMRDSGSLPLMHFLTWKELVSLTESAFLQQLKQRYPGGRKRTPRYWASSQHESATFPVVGISWYECEAYSHFLEYQSLECHRLQGLHHRLAVTNIARMTSSDPITGNDATLHLGHLCVVSVFASGTISEELIYDLSGNILEWTTTQPGRSPGNIDLSTLQSGTSSNFCKCGIAWYQQPRPTGCDIVSNDSRIRARDSGFRLVRSTSLTEETQNAN